MSKSLRITLIALVWIVAAFLCWLPAAWAPFGHFLDIEQWPLGAATGWIARGAVARWSRNRRQRASG